MENIQEVLKQELEAFKKGLPTISDVDSLKTAQSTFKSEMEQKFSEVLKAADIEEISKAVTMQGELLQALKLQGEQTPKTFESQMKSINADLCKVIEDGKPYKFSTTRKAVTAANFTDSTIAYRDNTVGRIHRGMPFIADLFPKVNVGAGSGGTVVWHEQNAVTNNASSVNEGAESATPSNLTWIERSLLGKRISDNIKISKNQIKDVNYVMSEIQDLVSKNMRIKENDSLINGLGSTNTIAGILSYATAFATAGISIAEANLADLIGKCRTQIVNGTLGAAFPTNAIVNPADLDLIRYAKTDLGQYLFPNLISGGMPEISSIGIVENSLAAANTMIVGDFNMATLFVFDELTIEIKETEDDAQKGLVTVIAHMRENLRVRTNDAAAFVKVADIATTIQTITTGA